MLRIEPRFSASELVAYHGDDFIDDCQRRSESLGGTWFGKGAVSLGLAGQVKRLPFRRLCENKHPKTRHRLTQRSSACRRVAFDLVTSAPKSVSIMYLVMGDERVQQAHRKATAVMLGKAEELASARVRRAGENADRHTGNLVAAVFEHRTSRDDDPQLHSHAVVFNMTHDATEGIRKALEPRQIFKRSKFLTEIYRAVLVAELHRLGYPTYRTHDGFEIVGVNRDVIDVFSKRHAEIDQREAGLGSSGNPRLRATIAHRYRQPKGKVTAEIDGLRIQWMNQLSSAQSAQLEKVRAGAIAPIHTRKMRPGRALRMAAEHLFEHRSSIRTHHLFAEALAVSEGGCDVASLEQALALDRRFFRFDDLVFTRKDALAEFHLVMAVWDGINQAKPFIALPALSPHLTLEHRRALLHVLGSHDQINLLSGPAGSGKTSVQVELVRVLEASDQPVVIAAPTTAAVNVLKAAGFKAVTLQHLLRTKGRRYVTKNSVLLLDEAGQVSVAQMAAFFKLARKFHARVILVGDSRQHKSVEAGDALRILERHSKLHRAELSSIHRQTFPSYRQAIERIWQGNATGGFQALDRLGWIKELAEDDLRYKAVAERFGLCRKDGRSVLAVCATWREGHQVNEQIRERLRLDGFISGEDHAVDVLHPLHLTKAKRSQVHNYQPGYVITFRHRVDGFAPTDSLTVTGVEGSKLIVRTVHGLTIPLRLSRYAKDFSVFTPRRISLAQGDQVLILENRSLGCGNNTGLCNGELATIRRIGPSGDISLQDGRMIPANFRHFTHGYAITSQRAQAQTVDEVILAIDAQSAFCTSKAETFYVGASRGRERCTIFTDDKDLLLGAFTSSGERPGAFDLIPRTSP